MHASEFVEGLSSQSSASKVLEPTRNLRKATRAQN